MEINVKITKNGEKFISIADGGTVVSAKWNEDNSFTKNDGVHYEWLTWCEEFYEIFGADFEDVCLVRDSIWIEVVE